MHRRVIVHIVCPVPLHGLVAIVECALGIEGENPVPVIVLPKFGSELRFEPEPSRTGPVVQSKVLENG